MRVGISLPHYQALGDRDPVLAVIDAAEESGFDSVWTTDHVVVPRSIPEPYGNMLESLTVLAVAAGRTSRVLLGTSVIVLPQRETILLAKQAATLHNLSAGRLILGVGVGWLEREFVALGADFRGRGAATTAAIDRLRYIWGDAVRSEAAHASMADLLFSPANRGLPPIPIMVGGGSAAALRRAAVTGDGWHAVNSTVEDIAAGAAAMRAAGASDPVIQLRLPISPGRSRAALETEGLHGSANEIVQRIREYEAAGVSHLTLDPDADEVEGFLRDMRWIAAEVLPRVR